jgi:carboxylesterase
MAATNRFLRVSVIFLLVMSACSKNPEINNATMLDGDQLFDPSLYHPEKYLVSVAIENPSAVQKNTPVILTKASLNITS